MKDQKPHNTTTFHDTTSWREAARRGTCLPFSFESGDAGPAQLEIIAVAEADGGLTTTAEYQVRGQPLRVRCVHRFDPAFYLVRLHIELVAGGETAIIRNIRILDLPVAMPAAQHPPVLHGVTGGFRSPKFPPDALNWWEQPLAPGARFHLDSDGTGRSSNSQVPLWVLAGPESGLWFGPEWSGCWDLEAVREAETVRLGIGLPPFAFRMTAGETIRLPAVAFGPYRGDVDDGLNHVRKTILGHYLPLVDGVKPKPLVYRQGYNGHPSYETEETLYREVDRAAEVGCEVFCLDGGWNNPPERWDWFQAVGRWEDQRRFPKGLKTFGEYVKAKGMRFGLWLEPRAMPACALYQENKEAFFPETDYGLIDLGNPQGRRVFLGVFEQFINDYGADWIWIDYNIDDPRRTCWDRLEAPDRRGLMELGFYQGWYECVGEIMRKYPHVWIESCASGGRIIDLAQLRYSHSIWICDHIFDDDHNRNLRGSANRFLPAACIQNSIFLNKTIAARPPVPGTPLDGGHRFLTYFSGAFGFGQGLSFWRQEDLAEAARYAALYKQYRQYLEGDFYRLLPPPCDLSHWDGWQYDDPANDEGIMLFFRPNETWRWEIEVVPKRLSQPADYIFETVGGEMTVKVLADRIVVTSADKPAAAIIRYRRQER
jgi:alpha-galactosidase